MHEWAHSTFCVQTRKIYLTSFNTCTLTKQCVAVLQGLIWWQPEDH